MQDQQPKSDWKSMLTSLWLRSSNIRWKIIVPYLFLTLVVAVVGIYIVITLVAGSLDERLDNHLLEAGRAVLNGFARVEIEHMQSATILGATRGVAQALVDHDYEAFAQLVVPFASTQKFGVLIVVDAAGDTVLNMLRQDDRFEPINLDFDVTYLWMIRELLAEASPTASPRRAVGLHPVDGRYYYFTAVPLPAGPDGEFLGVLLIGTALDVLLPDLKSSSMADIIVYMPEGQAVASTLTSGLADDEKTARLNALSISPDLYTQVFDSEAKTRIENITINQRPYRLSRGPLIVARERLTVFAVVLPANFIVVANTASRNTYILIFTAAMAAVVLLGVGVARRITAPLDTLVKTSHAVAEGNLDQRTGIHRADEIGALATTFDQMTERLGERTVALQAALQVQKETATRMRSILSSIGDGVLLEDTEGNITSLNKAAESMLEDMALHFLSGPMRELPVAEKDGNVNDQLNPWLLERRRFQVANKVYTAHSASVATDDGENLGTVIVLRDVTAEVEAEQLKDAFVAHVSHELRTPLTAIKGYTALLLATAGSSLSQTQHGFLDRISRQTDNLVFMINALLDFSEVESGGRLGLRQEPLSLSTLVDDIYKEWRPQMEEKSLAFTLEIEPDIPLVNADVARLRWALINLVRNAYQYTDSGGAVRLHLSSSYDRVAFEVTDTGVGISVEDQRRLFSRFHRVMQSRDDNVRGLGLGLYVTKAIVEAHGGYIQVVSEVGGGSTFTLVLPAMREHDVKRVGV
ncbi:MAG TPA: ATP-binding protein [Anaerolineae bacterium]|nr:ATP-binding protein [Anaerolineae bacterium]HQI84042.1 ATP-binding protein [Anaerolineae bacterium]